MEKKYLGSERREFLRLEYSAPVDYKVCKLATISKLLQGYTSDISPTGLLCNIKHEVKKGDIIWLSFDRATLIICEELERRSLIYQNGVIGKVVRVEPKEDGIYGIGVHFLTRKEKDTVHMFQKDSVFKNE